VLSVVLVAIAACGPRIDPLSPFDEDDPRAGGQQPDAGAETDAAPRPIDAAAPGARTGTVSRASVNAVLDASPGELLKGIEVAAVRPGGEFRGWQLVRLLPEGKVFAAVDLAPGDMLVSLNGHTLETPQDLSALWLELYRAAAIDATIDRRGQRFTIHFDIYE
jgi:type II secretory pathway component PulC